jgi:hypothetical protein
MDGTRGARLLAIIPALLCAGCAVDPSDLIVRPDGSRLESVPGWRLRDVRTGQAIHFLYAPDAPRTTPLGTVELRLTGRDDARPAFARTPSLDVAYLGPTVGGGPHPDVAPLVDAFLQTVRRNDPGGLRLPSPPRYAQAPDAPAPGVPRAIDRLSHTAGLALVLAFLLALPWTVRALGRALGPADRRMLLILLGITAGAIALRLALPSRPVMHYMGYRLVQIAADLDPVPKYGAGALGLHHLLFRLTGPDHGAAIALHKVLGGLAVPVAAALMAALGAPRRAVLTGALLAAFTPLLVKDATSESLGVPALLWTLAGLALAARARTTARPLDGALALLPLSLAAMSRPEAIALVPLAALATWAVAPGPAAPVPRTRAATIAWLALGGVATALLALRAVQAALAVETELSLGNAPQLVSWGGVQAVLTGTLLRNAAFWPSLFPTVITVGAFAAPFLVERRMRAPVLVLGGIGLAWIALAQLDLPYVSIPRVQAPGLAFVALAGAWGLSVPASKWPVRMTGRVRTAGMIAGVAILLLSAAATVPTLWLRSGADDEEALLRDARAALPDGPVTIVRRGYGDPPREPAHLDWPDTWFAPPFRDDRVTGIAAFLADPRFDRPVYFLAGLRCHLRACGAQGPHPACVEMARRFRLEPVLEREVPLRTLPIDRPAQGRHADQDFGWCHDGPGPFRIGLYRVLPAGE